MEYIGKYPDRSVCHGNSKHQGTPYTRTKPELLEKVASLVDAKTPREVYKSMVLENSFDAPKDFKQIRNIKYQQSKKKSQNRMGKMNNLADEVLNCISMVDSNDFVQHFSKSKGVMPNFICYTENQINDLNFFLSQKSHHPVGVDRTFNLGRFFVTALVYKNLRVVRADDPAEHPLFIGPMLIHRDATFKAYYYFFSMVKASLQHSIGSFDN